MTARARLQRSASSFEAGHTSAETCWVASQTAGSTTRTYTLGPARRLRSWTDGSTTSTNHYPTASGDSPTWIGVTGGTWTRNITGIGGNLAALQTDTGTGTGTGTLQFADLHGDIVATTDDSTSATSIATYAESNEFGLPYFPTTAYARYGWLGTEQRSRDALAGLTLMVVHLYNPHTGRFLSTDPVLGGNASPYDYDYDYDYQDPYNTFDLNGQLSFFWKKPSWWYYGARAYRAIASSTRRFTRWFCTNTYVIWVTVIVGFRYPITIAIYTVVCARYYRSRQSPPPRDKQGIIRMRSPAIHARAEGEPRWFRPTVVSLYAIVIGGLMAAAFLGVAAPIVSGTAVISGILIRTWRRNRPWRRGSRQ
ncbi:hypothetical protein ND748_09225 [Frankia sp. AiPs1]|nr:hypothetical protein [Frankia sp. AiPs1]